MKKIRFLQLIILGLILGCGENGPVLVEVHGVLTLDGKPLVHKTIRFIPEPGTPGLGAGATTNVSGNYRLIAVRGGAVRDTMGVPPGAYKVIITEPMFPIDAKIPESQGEEPAPAIGLPGPTPRNKITIPPIYSNPETTKLRIQVPPTGGVIDLGLSTAG